MATSTTTNLNLVKETNTEPIVNHRGHFNDNMDLIDAAYNTLASRSRGQQTWGNLKQNTTWGELIGTNVVAATTTTDNLELIQPGYDSTVDVESFNDNMSILDSTIGAIDVTNDGSIADQLSAVQDSLSPYTVDLTERASAMTFPTGVSLYAGYQNTATLIGNIVVVKISIRMENATSEGKSIQGYLPEDLRPFRNVPTVCETGIADGKLQPASLNSDGALAIWSVNTGKTTYAIGTAVYVI